MILYVDAAKTEGGTSPGATCGKTAWRGVTDLNGREEVFRHPAAPGSYFEKGHNNPAEFCALVDGVRYLLSRPAEVECVYTDSVTARAWVLKGRAACNIRDQFGPEFGAALAERERWLAENPLSDQTKNKIRLWSKQREGRENPADFGNKR